MSTAILPRAFAPRGQKAEDVSALESRADVDPKEWLLAKKREIMAELNPLAAMHKANGQGSPADSARKRHRAFISKKILEGMATPPSETALERMANAHPRHRAFCRKLQDDATRYNVLLGEKEEIDYRLRARETELNAYSSEIKHL
jgi:hypothetical protein